MIFFDLDDTLIDFKRSEHMGIKAFYNQFSSQLKHTEEEFLDEWERIGKLYFEQYLNGELSFDQQKINRIIDLMTGLEIEINQEHALEYYDVYLTHFRDYRVLFDDVIPCLKKLNNQRLGI